METTLHRQLKALYADPRSQEVVVDGFRIDAMQGDRLIEVQCASLSAIRDKIRALTETHKVHVVKPLAARKTLVTRASRRGAVVATRYSPLRQTPFHLFDELVHFMGVFPHRKLTLELVLAEWEEHRVPARRRRWKPQHRVVDRVLRTIQRTISLRTASDLAALLPEGLPAEFTTSELASAAKSPRWLAQKAAYCLRKAEIVELLGKRQRSLLYRLAPKFQRSNARRRRQAA